MNEFDLIKNYFAQQKAHRSDVITSIGDDAAIVMPPSNQDLAITTDTLVVNRHFLESAAPFDIGHKSLAVNLSDLAAMGATPAWATLAITLPEVREDWIKQFCDGFFGLAERFQLDLIGGDITHGPLSITVQTFGLVAQHQAILRSGAKPSDLVYVTGTLGDAGLALQYLQNKIQLAEQDRSFILQRLNRPEPRIDVGQKLIGLASSAIDISDGLAADLKHILKANQVGALIQIDQLPLSAALKHTLPYEKALELALTAGDDYEICFTVPIKKKLALEKQLSSIPSRYTCIGKIVDQDGLDLRYQNGSQYHGPTQGYQHF